MEIARERFLDDTRRFHLSLSLRSRTPEMHSALSGLSPDQRDAVGVLLARALDEIQGLLANEERRTKDEGRGPRTGTDNDEPATT